MFFPHRVLARSAVRTFLGILLSTAAAGAVSALVRHHAANWVPIGFLLVVLIVALWFGTAAGILSSLLAALVFAIWLYAPVGHVAVQSAGARANLGWMILAGTSLSFLLSTPGNSEPRKHQ